MKSASRWFHYTDTPEIISILIILGAFAKLRRVTVNFLMSVYLHVRPPARINTAPTERIFKKFAV
jgi:hypothetical protein